MQLQSRFDQREQAARRSLRAKRGSGEESKVNEVLKAQIADARSAAGTVSPMIARIEQAWSPDIALLSLETRNVGAQGKLDGEATDLGQVYAFAERLRGERHDMVVALLRHGTKPNDPASPVLFSLSLSREKP
jgi:hypothetical protein